MRSLRPLSSLQITPGMRVLLRVDWNVPLEGGMKPEASLKIERSLETIEWLQSKKAVVIVLTHLGRPKGMDSAFSTAILAPLLKKNYQLSLTHHAEQVSQARERSALLRSLEEATPGSVHLLENVRFEAGEEKNAAALGKAYASLGGAFVNEAFASCHRAHASVVGIAKYLPTAAGKSLVAEDKALNKVLSDKTSPRVAIVGGLKLSTKLPLLQALLKKFDYVLVGGAMATTIKAAQGQAVGASFVEPDCFREAKRLVGSEKLLLPEDVVVAKGVDSKQIRATSWEEVGETEKIFDVGPKTLKTWAKFIKQAKVVVWNGPVGMYEIAAFGVGSRFVARAVAARSKGSAYGVAGGGETIAVILSTKTLDWFDHVSTGGGAMLDYLSSEGALPGLVPLIDSTRTKGKRSK